MSNKHSHYHKSVEGLKTVDVYRVLSLWTVTDPAIQHAVKKLLNAGQRGMKDWYKDLREAIDSIERAIQMRDEDQAYNTSLIDAQLHNNNQPAPHIQTVGRATRPPAAPPAPSDPAPMPAPTPAQINAATGTPASLHAAYHHGRADALQGLAPSNPFPAGSAEMPKYVEGYKAGAKKMVDSDTAQTSAAQAPLDPYSRGRAACRSNSHWNPYKLGTIESTQWQNGYEDEATKPSK